MGAIPVSVEFDIRALQHVFIRKRTQQPVMTRARLVDSREQRIDHAQAAGRVDALCGKALSSTHESIPRSGMLERTHDGCADRDDPPALRSRALDRPCSGVRDAVRLIERQAAIDLQSSAKPADGGSKATGGPAIGVHTFHSASGAGTCAYWIGLPWRARL